MKSQRRKPACPDGAGVKVAFGVGVLDGPASAPEVARRFGAIVAVAMGRGGRDGLREKPVRLGERFAQRGGAGAQADEIENIPVLTRGSIGPLAWRSRRGEPHEE